MKKNILESKIKDNFNKKIEQLEELFINSIKQFKSLNSKYKKDKIISNKDIFQYILFHNRKIHFNDNNINSLIVWKNHKLSKQFLANEEINYNDFLKPIFHILMGDFSSVKNYKICEKDLKYCCIFSLTLPNNRLLIFVIYYQRTQSIINEHIKFLDIINKDSPINPIKYQFLSSLSKNNEKYPIIEFDESSILSGKNIFFQIHGFTKDDIKIQFPSNNISIENQQYFKLEKAGEKENYILQLNPRDFILSTENYQLIYECVNQKFLPIIKEMFINGKFGKTLSNQEKFLVNTLKPFLLSGRPGTGKTTVILFKLFCNYINYLFRRSLMMNNQISFEAINLYLKEEVDIKSQFKICFTSLSHILCDEIEKTFIKMLEKQELDINYNSLDKLESSKIDSFRDIKSYPIFFNFRKLLFLIDGSLTFQFFSRSRLRKFEGLNEVQNEYSPNYVYEVNNYKYYLIEEFYINNNINFNDYPTFPGFHFSSFILKNPICSSTYILKESNENTFIDFYSNYEGKSLQKNKNKRKKKKNSIIDEEEKIEEIIDELSELNVSPIEIYAQINSVIKGSLFSHLSYNNCISREEYHEKGKKLTGFEERERDLIYDLYLYYDKYLKQEGYFDINDVVNHCIRQFKIEFKDKALKLLDFLFIDEIQDLTINQIYLLILITRYSKVYAGDTCQTISPINRFRFIDLKNIFYNFEIIIPNYNKINGALLSLNYRLNSKVLRLTNFFQYFIRELFPNTIDKIQDDFSVKVTSFIPTFVTDLDFLIDPIHKKKESFEGEFFTLSNYHCFICKTRNERELINKKYNEDINVNDVMSCKGLEYEIVVIYNFFTSIDEEEEKEKNIDPKKIIIEKLKNRKKKQFKTYESIFEFLINKINDKFEDKNISHLSKILNNENLYEIASSFDDFYKGKSNYEIMNLIINEHKNFIYPYFESFEIEQFDKHLFYHFCSILKQLYVMISRSQTFLIFYEENLQSSFLKYCIQKGLISTNKKQLEKEIKKYFSEFKRVIKDKNIFENNADELLKKRRYNDAKYFYLKAENKLKYNISNIYEIYDNIKLMNKDKYKEEFKKMNESLLELIVETNQIGQFEDKDSIQAFACINLGKYDEGIKLYENDKKYDIIADIYLNEFKDIKKAFENYKKCHFHIKAINCLIDINDYENLYNYLNEFFEEIGDFDYHSYFKHNLDKYINLHYPKEPTCESFFFDKQYIINNLNHKKNRSKFILDFSNNKSESYKPNCPKMKKEYYKNIFAISKNDIVFEYSEKEKTNFSIINSLFQQYYNHLIIKEEKNDDFISECKKRLNVSDLVKNFINVFFYHSKNDCILYIMKYLPQLFITKTYHFNRTNFYSLFFTGQKNIYFEEFLSNLKSKIISTFIELGKQGQFEIEEINSIMLKTLIINSHFYYIVDFMNCESKILLLGAMMGNKYYLQNNLNLDSFSLDKKLYIYNAYIRLYFGEYYYNFNSSFYLKFKKFLSFLSYDYYFNYEEIIQYIKEFNNYIQKDLFFFQDEKKHIKYLEIGSIISLFIFTSFYNRFFNNIDLNKILNLSQQLYILFKNLVSFKVDNQSKEKEIVLYSIFNCFGITPVIDFNIVEMTLYSNFNFCLINQSSPIMSNEIIKQTILYEEVRGIFDSNCENIVYSFDAILNIFLKYLANFTYHLNKIYFNYQKDQNKNNQKIIKISKKTKSKKRFIKNFKFCFNEKEIIFDFLLYKYDFFKKYALNIFSVKMYNNKKNLFLSKKNYRLIKFMFDFILLSKKNLAHNYITHIKDIFSDIYNSINSESENFDLYLLCIYLLFELFNHKFNLKFRLPNQYDDFYNHENLKQVALTNPFFIFYQINVLFIHFLYFFPSYFEEESIEVDNIYSNHFLTLGSIELDEKIINDVFFEDFIDLLKSYNSGISDIMKFSDEDIKEILNKIHNKINKSDNYLIAQYLYYSDFKKRLKKLKKIIIIYKKHFKNSFNKYHRKKRKKIYNYYHKFQYYYPIKKFFLNNIYDNIINCNIYIIYLTLKDLLNHIKDKNLKELIESFTKEYEKKNLYYLMIYFLKKFNWFKTNFKEDCFYYFSGKKIYQLKFDEKNLLSFISDNQQNNNNYDDDEIKYEDWSKSFFSLYFEKTENTVLKNILFDQYKDNDTLFEDCPNILKDL